MAFKPFTKKESKEPKREEKKEAKLPPKARAAVEKKESKGGFPAAMFGKKAAAFKSGGKAKGKC